MDGDKPKFYDTKQRLAGFQLIKKTQFSVTFYEEYLNYAQDERIITDDNNTLGYKNYDGFKENRHDQTIFSLLTKTYNLKAFRDPSQWSGRYKLDDNKEYPQIIELTRNKS